MAADEETLTKTESSFWQDSQHWDAIVVGLGGVGSAALYHFAQRGARTLGIDRFSPPHNLGSSHGETRIIRQAYFEHPDYVPLVQHAFDEWQALEKAAQEQLLFKTGLLEIGPANGQVLPGILKAASQHDLPIERLTADEIRTRFPQFRIPNDDLEAVFETEAGFLDVDKCVAAHLHLAKQHGASILPNTPIRSWRETESGVEVETEQGSLHAKQLVLCLGSWAPLHAHGMNIPMKVLRKAVLWYRLRHSQRMRLQNGCPAYLVELPDEIYYGFPSLDGVSVKVAQHSGGDLIPSADDLDRNILPSDRQAVESFLTTCLPDATPEFIRGSACMYTMTPDEHFVLDWLPESDAIFFCGGLSGHGFKFTCVLGRALADLATHGKTELPVQFLSRKRFGTD